MEAPAELLSYLQSGLPLICEVGGEMDCEFWPIEDLVTFNREYEVPRYASGYFGFATNGGGEMFAFGPEGEVVCLPFIGMEPKSARRIAGSFNEFRELLTPISVG
jgi:hypothetical protein